MILHETQKIQVIATEKSGNRKIGKAIQIWIVPRNETVTDSRRNGNDAKTQCMGCPLASNNGCYVGSYYVDAIQRAAWAGKKPYAKNKADIVRLVKNKFVRFGAYGNPSMIPLSLVKLICKHASGWTGYFHDWHLMPFDKAKEYAKYFMVSCEPDNYVEAYKLGFRAFVTRDPSMPVPAGLVDCPSSRGVTCSECQLCCGTSKLARSISIPVHGYQIKSATKAIAL